MAGLNYLCWHEGAEGQKWEKREVWIKRGTEDIAAAPWEKKKDEAGKDPRCGLNIDSI